MYGRNQYNVVKKLSFNKNKQILKIAKKKAPKIDQENK